MNLGVIGLGKLGLPLLALLADSGHKVTGYDSSDILIKFLKKSVFEYTEPELNDLLNRNISSFEFTDSLEKTVGNSEVIFIIVPTPSNSEGVFDNSAIIEICSSIRKIIDSKPKSLTINIVSTVMPGSCEGEIAEALKLNFEKNGDFDLGICYSPEFIALGSVIQNMKYPDMQLLGSNTNFHAEKVEKVLKSITRNSSQVRRMSLKEAELVKISVNNFVTMKIAFANTLGMLSEKIGGINIDVVTEAIGLDSRIGGKYLAYGAPYGGPCFPRDTRALSALLSKNEIEDSLPKVVDHSNDFFVKFIEDKIASISLKKKVGVLGLSYKSDTPVIEDSPSIKIIKSLSEHGVNVIAWDPQVHNMNLNGLDIANDFDSFTDAVDLCVIMRPMPELSETQLSTLKSRTEIVDLWRKIKN